MSEVQQVEPLLLDGDWEGLGELLFRAEQMPPALRPIIGPTMDHQFAAQVYLEEMEAAGQPQLGPWQELQLESLLEVADGLQANSEGSGPLEVWAVTGADPKPRDPIILNGLLALMNRGHVAYIQDMQVGEQQFVARLVIFRHN